MIRDIMLANPHGVKREDLLGKLQQRVPPIPDYMMAELMTGLDSVSVKEEREAEIAWYEQERDAAFNQLLNLYLTDTTIYSREDSITALVTNHGSLNSKYFLVNRCLERGDSTDAFALLSNLTNEFVMDSSQQVQHQDYLTIFSLWRSLQQQGKPVDSLDVESRQQLFQIADHYSRPAAMAQNILQYLGQEDFPEVYILPTSGLNLRNLYSGAQANQSNVVRESDLSIYPNPCKDYFIIDYCFKGNPTNAMYCIQDQLGREIFKGQFEDQQNQLIIRTSNFSSGLYTLRLLMDGKVEKVLKLNVIR